MRTLVLVAALVASAFAANLVNCGRNGVASGDDRFPWYYNPGDENTSWIFANPNACTKWETPYCIPVNMQAQDYIEGDGSTHKFGCAECRSKCDCPIGKYCQNVYSEHNDFGKCISYKDKLGTVCDGNLDASSSYRGRANVDPYYGDDMLCAVYYQFKDHRPTHNATARMAAWTGTCVHGKCRECNSYMMYTPSHTTRDLWYTGSAQSLTENQKLECLWGVGSRNFDENAPYKYKPRICHNFGWKHTNSIAVAAPAALLLIISAVFAL